MIRRRNDDSSNGMYDDSDWDDDQNETISCPYCRRQIYEDSERCPYCEKYISSEDLQTSQRPIWVIVTALVLLLVFYLSLFR